MIVAVKDGAFEIYTDLSKMCEAKEWSKWTLYKHKYPIKKGGYIIHKKKVIA